MPKKIRLLFLTLLFLSGLSGRAATVDTLEIQSVAMHTKLRAGVVIPKSYKKSKTPFPVLYLLHGYSGNFRDWLRKTPDKQLLHTLADQYNMIIVTPDGGFSSWYLDSPIDKNTQYETFITRELRNHIDTNYRTIKGRNGRVISGLSMGGHGAFYLATRHPDLYCAAGSMSGALDLSSIEGKQFVTTMETLLGPKAQNLEKFQTSSVVHLTDKMKNNQVQYVFDCGVDDFLIQSNRELHMRLVFDKIPHEYTERPGGHTWPYWENALPYHMLFFQKILKQNGALPAKS